MNKQLRVRATEANKQQDSLFTAVDMLVKNGAYGVWVEITGIRVEVHEGGVNAWLYRPGDDYDWKEPVKIAEIAPSDLVLPAPQEWGFYIVGGDETFDGYGDKEEAEGAKRKMEDEYPSDTFVGPYPIYNGEMIIPEGE